MFQACTKTTLHLQMEIIVIGTSMIISSTVTSNISCLMTRQFLLYVNVVTKFKTILTSTLADIPCVSYIYVL